MADICLYCDRDMSYRSPVNPDDPTEYSHKTSVEIRGVYDGGLFYADVRGCGRAWHRWPEGHYLRERAQTHLDKWNQNIRERELEERLANDQ